MPYNGSGTFTLPSGNPVVTGSTISSTVHNNTMSEIATALSTAITKDGQTVVTANLPMAGYRHTGVGNPTARTQYASVAGVQDGTYTYLTSVAGTNTITATAPLSMAAYATGQVLCFIPANTNTGAATININSIGAKNIYADGVSLKGGELPGGIPVLVVYDGTRFHVLSHGKPYNVRHFGAKGDGTTDDRAAIDACISAAASNSGQQVYAPSGTYMLSSFSSGYYTVKPKSGVSVLGDGPSTVFKIDDGLRSPTQGISFLYDHDDYFENCTFRDFAIDWNGENNLDTGSSSTEAVNRMGGAAGMKGVRFINLTHKNAAGAHCIFVSNESDTGNACEDVHVSGCSFLNVCNAITGNACNDHTSVYMNASTSSIIGNHFIQPNLDDDRATAFETHKGDVICSGNVIYGYNKMMNIGAQVGSASNIQVTDNVANAVSDMIDLFTANSYVLEGVRILDNTIRLRQISGVPFSGIRGAIANLASSANISNITIGANKISGPASGIDLGINSSCIQLYRCDDVKIYDNEIELFPGEGVLIQAETATKKLRRIDVSENKLRACGIGTTAANKRAMAFNAGSTPGTDDIDYLWVNDNVIICDAPVGTASTYGIDFNSGRFPNTWVEDNDISGAATAPIRKNGATADLFFIRGKGAINPFGTLRAAMGSEWFDSTNGRFNRATLGTNDTDCWMSESWAGSMPASGTYQAGDKVWHTAPTTTLLGWIRLTTGSGHVLNTDWAEINI